MLPSAQRPGEGAQRSGSGAGRLGRSCGPLAGALLLVGCVLVGCGGTDPSLGAVVTDAVRAGPGPRSAEYQAPSAAYARSVALAVAALAAGAQLEDPPPGHRLTEVAEPDGDGGLTALVADRSAADSARGHGLYVVRRGSAAGTVVQVPHPLADRGTAQLGSALFTRAGADVLMVATAHRTAGGGRADVSAVAGSVFAAVDGAVVGPGSTVLQVHGFAADNHPDSYGDVVLSSGVRTPSPLVTRLAEQVQDAGFAACVYDGRRCRRLAGTRNLQGLHARAVGAQFVHVEISDRVRDDATRTDELLGALAQALRAESPAL